MLVKKGDQCSVISPTPSLRLVVLTAIGLGMGPGLAVAETSQASKWLPPLSIPVQLNSSGLRMVHHQSPGSSNGLQDVQVASGSPEAFSKTPVRDAIGFSTDASEKAAEVTTFQSIAASKKGARSQLPADDLSMEIELIRPEPVFRILTVSEEPEPATSKTHKPTVAIPSKLKTFVTKKTKAKAISFVFSDASDQDFHNDPPVSERETTLPPPVALEKPRVALEKSSTFPVSIAMPETPMLEVLDPPVNPVAIEKRPNVPLEIESQPVPNPVAAEVSLEQNPVKANADSTVKPNDRIAKVRLGSRSNKKVNSKPVSKSKKVHKGLIEINPSDIVHRLTKVKNRKISVASKPTKKQSLVRNAKTYRSPIMIEPTRPMHRTFQPEEKASLVRESPKIIIDEPAIKSTPSAKRKVPHIASAGRGGSKQSRLESPTIDQSILEGRRNKTNETREASIDRTERLTNWIHKKFDGSAIQIVTNNGVLTVSGEVNTNDHARQILRLVRRIYLVPVSDQLVIR